jgi:hypothetical protein
VAFLRPRIARQTTQIEGNSTAIEKVICTKYHKMWQEGWGKVKEKVTKNCLTG